eukprot:31126-Pelagococcus_subviridis.AAC.9
MGGSGYAGYAPGHKVVMATPLQQALKAVKDDKSLETMEKLTRNSAQAPAEEKFRRVRAVRRFPPQEASRRVASRTSTRAASRDAARRSRSSSPRLARVLAMSSASSRRFPSPLDAGDAAPDEISPSARTVAEDAKTPAASHYSCSRPPRVEDLARSRARCRPKSIHTEPEPTHPDPHTPSRFASRTRRSPRSSRTSPAPSASCSRWAGGLSKTTSF